MWEQERRVAWPMAGGQAAGRMLNSAVRVRKGQIVQGLGSMVESGFFFFLKDNGKVLAGFLSREMIQYDLCHLLSSQHKIYHIYQAF